MYLPLVCEIIYQGHYLHFCTPSGYTMLFGMFWEFIKSNTKEAKRE